MRGFPLITSVLCTRWSTLLDPSILRVHINYLGARIPIQHTGLNLDMWRKHLLGYEHVELCQYLEFGFPLGLQQDPEPALECSYRNHGSAYQYYTWIDKFVEAGLHNCDLSGPMVVPPFNSFQTSPLMTAPKKPNGRRAVFDATFGESSLNVNTQSDHIWVFQLTMPT